MLGLFVVSALAYYLLGNRIKDHDGKTTLPILERLLLVSLATIALPLILISYILNLYLVFLFGYKGGADVSED